MFGAVSKVLLSDSQPCFTASPPITWEAPSQAACSDSGFFIFYFTFLILSLFTGISSVCFCWRNGGIAVAQKNVMFWERLPKSLGNRDLIFRCSSHQMKETFCKAICWNNCCANSVLNAAGNGEGGEKPGKWVTSCTWDSCRELLEGLGPSIGSWGVGWKLLAVCRGSSLQSALVELLSALS